MEKHTSLRRVQPSDGSLSAWTVFLLLSAEAQMDVNPVHNHSRNVDAVCLYVAPECSWSLQKEPQQSGVTLPSNSGARAHTRPARYPLEGAATISPYSRPRLTLNPWPPIPFEFAIKRRNGAAGNEPQAGRSAADGALTLRSFLRRGNGPEVAN